MTHPDYPGRDSFSGVTYDPTLDFERLSGQMRRVAEVMSDGGWWTLFDLVTMKEELSGILGREVDLVSRRGIEGSRNYIRRQAILSAAEVVHVERS